MYGDNFNMGYDQLAALQGMQNMQQNMMGDMSMQGQMGMQGSMQMPMGMQPNMCMPYQQTPQAVQNPYMAGQSFQMGVNPLNISFNKQGEMKTPAASDGVIRAFLANNLNMPVAILDFVRVSEPFASRGTIKHACKFNLLNIEEIVVSQLYYFDKAAIDVAYCPNCLKVIYYFEKLSY